MWKIELEEAIYMEENYGGGGINGERREVEGREKKGNSGGEET